MELGFNVIFILTLVAILAGFVDSIAGGGGMITIPALWMAGIPPQQALGTNKLQSCFGSFGASLYFYKKGYLKLRENLLNIIIIFTLASIGAMCVNLINKDILNKIVPFLLIAFGIYFLFSPRIKEEASIYRLNKIALAGIFGVIGFYDGFFGPGTGSFYMLILILLGGYGIKGALANAKLYNFISNFASLCVFIIYGSVIWKIGIAMGIGQFIGAFIGSKVALTHGVKIIKPMVVIVSICMSVKLLLF